MQYEIDFLPVGEGCKGGDAITLRYGDFTNRDNYKVVVIDGGTKTSGKLVVDHIKNHYGTTQVDVVVATHLHQDHIGGLTEVLEGLTIGKLVMNLPRSHSDSIKKMTNTQMTISKLEEKLEKSLNGLSNLEDLANEKGIPIIDAFSGDYIFDNELLVLGPSKEYYENLIANFSVTPEVKSEHSIVENVSQFIKNAIEWVKEELHIETLSDDYEDTSPENNSSIVLLLTIDNKRLLFTGDSGKSGLSKAIEFSNSNNINISGIDFFDVPHHGSKRNLGPTILNTLRPRVAFVSCPKDGDPKHPSRKVINALIRRDCDVYTTKGQIKKHGNTTRDGWSTATPEDFYNEVEQ